jgi:hypothetical protein
MGKASGLGCRFDRVAVMAGKTRKKLAWLGGRDEGVDPKDRIQRQRMNQ